MQTKTQTNTQTTKQQQTQQTHKQKQSVNKNTNKHLNQHTNEHSSKNKKETQTKSIRINKDMAITQTKRFSKATQLKQQLKQKSTNSNINKQS